MPKKVKKSMLAIRREMYKCVFETCGSFEDFNIMFMKYARNFDNLVLQESPGSNNNNNNSTVLILDDQVPENNSTKG